MRTNPRREHLREALIGAAERAIAAHGLASLKARDLAREAECALGAIYTVFPDLDSLILAVNGRTLGALAAVLDEAPGVIGAGRVDGGPVDRLVAFAVRYLDFAVAHTERWRALFQHRMSGGRPVPDWYRNEQARLFARVEAALGAVGPQLDPERRALLARTVFSAVHGVVSLGLDEKLASLPVETLRGEVESLVTALGRGLARPESSAQ